MMVIVYILAVVLFSIVFFITRLSQSCGQVLAIAQQARKMVADRTLDDIAKGCATREAALQMLHAASLIVIKSTLTVAAALLPIWLADEIELVAWEDTIRFAMRWDVLGITTIVMLTVWAIWRCRPKSCH